MVSGWGLFSLGEESDKTEHALLGDGTYYKLPQKEQSWRKCHCLGPYKQGLIGLMFFNETANSEQYLHMLRNDFLSQLTATGLPLKAHVVYARRCHIAWCKHRAGLLGHCVRPSCHVKPLSGPSQLQQLLATSQPWPISCWLQFMVFLGEAVPMKTI
jgi:hypothetical protein